MESTRGRRKMAAKAAAAKKSKSKGKKGKPVNNWKRNAVLSVLAAVVVIVGASWGVNKLRSGPTPPATQQTETNDQQKPDANTKMATVVTTGQVLAGVQAGNQELAKKLDANTDAVVSQLKQLGETLKTAQKPAEPDKAPGAVKPADEDRVLLTIDPKITKAIKDAVKEAVKVTINTSPETPPARTPAPIAPPPAQNAPKAQQLDVNAQMAADIKAAFGGVPAGVSYAVKATETAGTPPREGCKPARSEKSPDGTHTFTRWICPKVGTVQN